ncbi:Ig-like domain-containing protein [Rhodococcus maanshanensis]|uniref:Ig-like domain (Group 3) n=2 Tax=Rhodococcus maanshanensis TaxID=183556 RepID=A0A1H7Y5N2_9NOCA|nr:Ig-like domain-containing protein [Rhodococcus maanshanensis]SEM40618.1 Ig-like domain (group 3) [Rhodococcus maanshanensis]
MSGRSVRRTIAMAGAFAVTAGFAVTMGAGGASAAPATITWADGGKNFTRTISNVAPAEGEVVTVSTTIAGTDTINWFEDYRPTCITYKKDSAKVAGLPVALASNGAGLLRVAGSWDASTSPTFEFQYVIGANCAREVALNTGIKYSAVASSGENLNLGPAYVVTKNVSTTVLEPVGPLKAGVESTLKSKVLGGRAGDLVKYFSGTNEIGSAALDATGAASFKWKPAANQAGPHDLTAKFLATPFATESVSAVQSVTVDPGDQTTQTTLIMPSSSPINVDVIIEAQVSPFPGAGTLTFKNGITVLGTAPVGADGKASVVQNFTVPGNKTITAVFSGAPGFAGSTSTAQTLNITDPGAVDVATTTTLNVPAIAQKGVYVFLRANVAPRANGGTVQFFSGAEPLGNPATVKDGLASVSYLFTTSGVRDVRAVYSGAPGYLGSEASTTVTVQDEPLPAGGSSLPTFGS